MRPPKDALPAMPIWDAAQELAAQVPDCEWRKVPSDLARNLHHDRRAEDLVVSHGESLRRGCADARRGARHERYLAFHNVLP